MRKWVRLIWLWMLMGCGFVQPSVSAEEQTVPETVVIDVRTASEFATGHLQDALNLDFRSDRFRSEVEPLNRDAVYVLYCRSGNRAGQAKQMMEQMGFHRVSNLGGVAQASATLGVEIVK